MRASYIQNSAQSRKQTRRYQLPHVGDLVHKTFPETRACIGILLHTPYCISTYTQNPLAFVRWFIPRLVHYSSYHLTGRYWFPTLPLFQSLFIGIVALYAWAGLAAAEPQNQKKRFLFP